MIGFMVCWYTWIAILGMILAPMNVRAVDPFRTAFGAVSVVNMLRAKALFAQTFSGTDKLVTAAMGSAQGSSSVLRIAVGPAGMAAIASAQVFSWGLNRWGNDLLTKAYMEAAGYSVQSGAWKKTDGTLSSYTSTLEANRQYVMANQGAGKTPTTLPNTNSGTSAEAQLGTIVSQATAPAYPAGCSGSPSGVVSGYYGTTNKVVFRGFSTCGNQGARIWYMPYTANDSQTGSNANYVTAAKSDIQTSMQTDLTSGARQSAAQQMTTELLDRSMEDQYKDYADSSNSLSSPSGDGTKMVAQVISETLANAVPNAVRDAIVAADGQTTSNPTLTQPTDNTSLITGLIQALRNLLGLDQPTPDISATPAPSETENETVTDEDDITSKVAQEKERSGTILDGLYDATMGLKTTIMESVSVTGGGVCSYSTSAYGGSVTLSICDVNLSTVRTIVIAVGTIAAALILLA